MRTVKASEVVKGMRVRVEQVCGPDTTRTVEGPVRCIEDTPRPGSNLRVFTMGNLTLTIDADHPVTVLAEPEPEWVEGAWYRCRTRSGDVRHLQRTADNGWSTTVDGYTAWVDSDGEITVLGRVLIVDWPGDDVAREVAESAHWYHVKDDGIAELHTALADAIRTQGGVR